MICWSPISKAVKSVGLVGPHARLQPAGLVVVGDIDRCDVDATARPDTRHRGRHRRSAARPGRQHDRRRSTDGAARIDVLEEMKTAYRVDSVIHYKPVYLFDLFQERGYREGECPVAGDFGNMCEKTL